MAKIVSTLREGVAEPIPQEERKSGTLATALGTLLIIALMAGAVALIFSAMQL